MPNMGLRETLLKKEQELEKLVQIAEKHIDSPLSGTLHISMIKGKPRYYHCYLDKNGNKQLKYLSAVKEGPKIMELAQHSYNAAFLKTATDQLKAVRRALNRIDEEALANVFALLHTSLTPLSGECSIGHPFWQCPQLQGRELSLPGLLGRQGGFQDSGSYTSNVKSYKAPYTSSSDSEIISRPR